MLVPLEGRHAHILAHLVQYCLIGLLVISGVWLSITMDGMSNITIQIQPGVRYYYVWSTLHIR